MAHVLFIYPNINTRYAFSPAIQMLSAVLKKEGHIVKLIHVNDEFGVPFDQLQITARVAKFKPDLIGLSATTFEYDTANTIAGWVKTAFPYTPIMLGGIHATIQPGDLWKSNFDIFCIGEGEIPITELARKIDNGEHIEGTPSCWFKASKRKNAVAPFITNLDTLPFYDFDIVDMDKLLQFRNGWLSISFSRGCPYSCAFCANPLIRKTLKGETSYCRTKSVPIVMEELLALINKHPNIKVINFDDDLLMIYPKWMKEFCEQYRTKIYEPKNIKFILNCRVDNLTDNIAHLLADSGCQELKIGVESGDEYLRNDILQKKLTDQQIINAFELTHKYRINTTAYLIMGIPGETEESMQKLFKLLWVIRPTLSRVAFLQPYIGTKLYDDCARLGLIDSSHKVKNWHEESPLTLPTLSPTQLLFYKHLLPWHLNAYMDFTEYMEAIDQYGIATYQQLLNELPNMVEEDKKLSATLGQCPHFRYFGKNTEYVEFYRPGN